MARSLMVIVAALLLGACSSFNFSSNTDETATWSAQRLYQEAKESMNDGNYQQAIRYYERLESRYPFGRFAQQAQLEIAYAYYRDNEIASAVAACDRFIKMHPNHPSVDYAYYLKGVVNFVEDQNVLTRISDQNPAERDPRSMRESFAAFKDLAQRFPDSKYTPDAIARMNWLVNALAQHEIAVARWYVKREAFVAAANRAQYVVDNYPGAPANEEALFIMSLAYQRLGLPGLSDDAKRVLLKNFPNGELARTGQLKTSGKWWQPWNW
jgi:outer membrane protein assembly factor BamD